MPANNGSPFGDQGEEWAPDEVIVPAGAASPEPKLFLMDVAAGHLPPWLWTRPYGQWDFSTSVPPDRRARLPDCVRRNLEEIEGKLDFAASLQSDSPWKELYKQHLRICAHVQCERVLDLIHCAEWGHGNPELKRFWCHHRLYCPTCCGYGGWVLQEEFCHRIPPGIRAFHIVLGVSPDPDHTHRLIFKAPGAVFDPNQTKQEWRDFHLPFTHAAVKPIRSIFKLFTRAMAHFCEKGKDHRCFFGAFGGPELGVKFLPLGVLVHAHFLVFSTDLSRDDLQQVLRQLKSWFGECRPVLTWRTEVGHVYPAVWAKLLTASDHIEAVARYVRKASEIAKAYGAARLSALPRGTLMENLNRDVREYFALAHLVWNDIPRIDRTYRFGACYPKRRDEYFGKSPKKKRKKIKKNKKRKRKKKTGSKGSYLWWRSKCGSPPTPGFPAPKIAATAL